MPKTKIVRKNAYMRLSEAKDYRTCQVSAGSPRKGSFRHVLISTPNAKRFKIKAFLKVSLVSSTLKLCV